MKSINEAIKHAMKVAEEKRNYFAPSGEFMGDNPDCVKCAEEHEQLAEWLEELKEARKGFEENRKAGYEHGYADGYKQAVDEFLKKCKERVEKTQIDRLELFEICEISEEVKGGKNE